MPKKTTKADEAKAASPAKRANLLKCPKCAKAMQPIEHQGVEIDRCIGCKGLWFDLLELDDIKKLRDSEKLDTGSEYQGAVNNRTERYDCPACHSEMVRMVDREQKHIWLESCSRCGGIYLDAGELRDLKERDLLDFLKSLRSAARK